MSSEMKQGRGTIRDEKEEEVFEWQAERRERRGERHVDSQAGGETERDGKN